MYTYHVKIGYGCEWTFQCRSDDTCTYYVRNKFRSDLSYQECILLSTPYPYVSGLFVKKIVIIINAIRMYAFPFFDISFGCFPMPKTF